MKSFIKFLCLLLVLNLVSCSKDKNMEDYKRDQLQQSMSRISSVSGAYTGPIISKIDGTSLGSVILKFQAKTDLQNSGGQNGNEQRAIVSGSLLFKSLTSSEVVFDNGYYDDVTGDFQVTIPITQDSGDVSKLSINGVVANGGFSGTIEVKGQPEYGGELNLSKNTPTTNISKIEVSGTRLQQIQKLNYSYVGEYTVGSITSLFKLNFINREIRPEQNFYKLFSPVRTINVNCDFTDFELNFNNAILDDKNGTLIGRDPVDQRGNPARATLYCVKFDDRNGVFGWDCEIQTKATTLNLHLTAKK